MIFRKPKTNLESRELSNQYYLHCFIVFFLQRQILNSSISRAKEIGCNNAETPDMFGHYREAKFTMTKHHWWWKVRKNKAPYCWNIHRSLVRFIVNVAALIRCLPHQTTKRLNNRSNDWNKLFSCDAMSTVWNFVEENIEILVDTRNNGIYQANKLESFSCKHFPVFQGPDHVLVKYLTFFLCSHRVYFFPFYPRISAGKTTPATSTFWQCCSTIV